MTSFKRRSDDRAQVLVQQRIRRSTQARNIAGERLSVEVGPGALPKGLDYMPLIRTPLVNSMPPRGQRRQAHECSARLVTSLDAQSILSTRSSRRMGQVRLTGDLGIPGHYTAFAGIG